MPLRLRESLSSRVYIIISNEDTTMLTILAEAVVREPSASEGVRAETVKPDLSAAEDPDEPKEEDGDRDGSEEDSDSDGGGSSKGEEGGVEPVPEPQVSCTQRLCSATSLIVMVLGEDFTHEVYYEPQTLLGLVYCTMYLGRVVKAPVHSVVVPKHY